MDELALKSLTWWELFALIINGNCLRNVEIEDYPLFKIYLAGKKNNSISQTISKILNTHSVGDTSSDKSKHQPQIFYKNSENKWCLNDEGRSLVLEINKKITK